MTDDITIPPEAAKALAMAILKITGEGIDMEEARAACRAMLRAWPGQKDEWRDNITFDGKPVRYSVIILPITEKQNAEG